MADIEIDCTNAPLLADSVTEADPGLEFTVEGLLEVDSEILGYPDVSVDALLFVLSSALADMAYDLPAQPLSAESSLDGTHSPSIGWPVEGFTSASSFLSDIGIQVDGELGAASTALAEISASVDLLFSVVSELLAEKAPQIGMEPFEVQTSILATGLDYNIVEATIEALSSILGEVGIGVDVSAGVLKVFSIIEAYPELGFDALLTAQSTMLQNIEGKVDALLTALSASLAEVQAELALQPLVGVSSLLGEVTVGENIINAPLVVQSNFMADAGLSCPSIFEGETNLLATVSISGMQAVPLSVVSSISAAVTSVHIIAPVLSAAAEITSDPPGGRFLSHYAWKGNYPFMGSIKASKPEEKV